MLTSLDMTIKDGWYYADDFPWGPLKEQVLTQTSYEVWLQSYQQLKAVIFRQIYWRVRWEFLEKLYEVFGVD